MQKWHDWDSTVRCDAQRIEQPTTEDEVVTIVRSAIKESQTVRTFGAGHSWSSLVPTDGVLINLDHLATPPVIDKDTGKATLSAGMRLRDAGPLLQHHGLTMRNLGAITPQSIAGAIGTGTHGTGLAYGVLGTQASAFRIVDGHGELKSYNITDHPKEMAALRLNLGCLGVVVSVTLDCVPDHSVQLDMVKMSLDHFFAEFDHLHQDNERVRAYWFPTSDSVYVHTMNKVDKPSRPGPIYSWFERVVLRKWFMGALWGTGRTFYKLIPSMNRIQETVGYTKGTRVGRCFDAITTPLPPFHQEAEVAVPLANGRKAVEEYGDLVRRNGLFINVPSEIRFAKADDALLSPGFGADVCYIGGYNAIYMENDTFYEMFCADLESRYGARRHWGKIGAPNRATALTTFPGFLGFEEIRRSFDPDGVFANEYIKELFAL